MKDDELIAQQALTQLEDHTGLKGVWNMSPHPANNDIDGTIDLELGANKLHFFVEIKKELREYQLPKILMQAGKYEPFMVIAERIFPALKQKLREHKIGYLDGAGNIFVQNTGNYLWLDGRKVIAQAKPVTNRAFTKTGLRTVFYLLWKKDAINLPYRTLAKVTGVALGNVKNIILGLQQAGFILPLNDKEMVLQNKKVLLERWMAGYRETLKPLLLIGKYRLNKPVDLKDLSHFPVKPGETAWGGEPAAELITNYLNPKELTVYTSEPRNVLMQKWRLIPDLNGYIQFYEKFWQDDDDVHMPIVPTLLVYADLMITGDPRNIETAERIYDEHLRHEYE